MVTADLILGTMELFKVFRVAHRGSVAKPTHLVGLVASLSPPEDIS